ncbi:aldehyde dehydrogenase [Grosmannia clavigera kw1407]|uniref:Aldehyde dehydrogenase n=1 Tax=Grosmannia clavigera (strain kw1407 / UAMH 11150) TaxID=655863 RepID=F0XIC9_GROCL|nr:aldehyde dehydrogenase [Grosmannia clavigera kw1407]EFX02549.1 aldehyde dehydrogenase [Grosmannia clavigera kw1407]
MSTQGSTTDASSKMGSKRRAPMSCDRCKSRKTKCVDPVPGPCKFCASIDAICHLDPSRRRQRPYYHVSEEEFRYMTKALEHFLPHVELSLQSLREVVQSLDAANPANRPSVAVSEASSDSVVVLSDDHRTPLFDPCPVKAEESAVSIKEIDEMHGKLGWLRIDSKGTYRYVGADSGYTFHAAVRSLCQRREPEFSCSSDLVPPFTAAPPLPPPSLPDSSAGRVSPGLSVQHNQIHSQQRHVRTSLCRVQIFLPRRDLCDRCVSRFFRDIQSVYWFVSAERFYAVLDRLYAGDLTSATPATLCSLYAVLALTCESEAVQAAEAAEEAAAAEPPPAARYLSLAKMLVPALCDEADIDSVRALCLLGLALQSSLFSNTAYIYIGAAARIALTLGLHLRKTIEPKGFLQRQVDLRLYSTLFLLDLDVALCYGNPPAITEDHAAGKLHDLSEQILSPGSHMPLHYLTVSCELAQIKRRLGRLLYGCDSAVYTAHTPLSDCRPSISAVNDVLSVLTEWYAAIPPHLCDVSRAAPFHQRSVSILHLRYWSATIFATRPFLLYSAFHPIGLAALPPAKRASFEEFSTTCIEAARKSLAVIGLMRDAALLSSLVTLDSSCLIEVLQVFLLALARGQNARADDVRMCLHTLQSMEQVFWTHHMLTEVMAQLKENGLLNDDRSFSPQKESPENYFLDIGQQQQQDEMMSGVMKACFADLNDPLYSMHDDGTDFGPMLSESLHDDLLLA